MTENRVNAQRTLVVLPTYNECENLVPMIEAVRQHAPQVSILIVDDNSPDGTGLIADRLASTLESIAVLHRAGKLGLGTAYIEAFQWALKRDFNVVLEMDVDFSHDPRYLPDLIQAVQQADLVIGSRYIAGGGTENWSTVRQLISRGGNWVARRGLGIKTRDATSGYRAFRRSTLERLTFENMNLRGYGFQIEVVYQVEALGLTIKEVPITFVERASGHSKMSKDIVLEAVLHIVHRRLRHPAPPRRAVTEVPGAVGDEV